MLPLLLFALVCLILLAGFPVAFTLAGVSLIFAVVVSQIMKLKQPQRAANRINHSSRVNFSKVIENQ